MRSFPMKSIIVGTAGHIDHGKTALVRALTGIETDRLEEEKRRGISIDLGFAHLELPGGLRVGFVDVPGHERFVKNMLAGAGGIDLALLVIAADESIKPQTREHFDICRLLGLRAGIVVLTKSDLVEGDLMDLVRLEAEEFVAGSFLEGAPIVAVSATTGAGLEELRQKLVLQAERVRGRDAAGYFRLPIDRSFTMRGFGTVVTGTLISGAVHPEQEVEVQPSGGRLRVRGVQVHGAAAAEARAGQRTALNLAGIDASELHRGMVLTEPARFQATRIIDCEVEMLPGAKPLKHRAPVHFHAWTAEAEAEVRLLQSDVIRPGERGFGRLFLRDPVLLLPGDRFILRMFSPVVTIGGGRVLDIAPPQRQRRAQAAERLVKLASASEVERVRLFVRESGRGLSVADLISRTGLPEPAVLAGAGEGVFLIREPQSWLVAEAWLDSRALAIEKRLADFHRANPLLPGAHREEIRGRELAGAPPFLLDAVLARTRKVTGGGEILQLASHKVRFHEEEEGALTKIEQAFERAGLAVPATSEVLSACGVEPARGRTLLQILLRRQTLIRVSDELVFHTSAITALKQMMSVRRGERFNVTEFKDWTAVSRKYAIPLLEYLDREKVTRREGDSRIVIQ
jgi:selenocysteine-specific elongation factor